MRIRSQDARSRDRSSSSRLLNRQFWISDIPRPILLCRALGHRPVVDGHDPLGTMRATRWVRCGRCSVRPEPQGSLDPAVWDLGAPYTGTFDAPEVAAARLDQKFDRSLPTYYPPGPWPSSPVWELSGQALVGHTFGGFSAQVKVGNGGSENKFAGHITLNPLGGLYVSFGDLGAGLQQRLNPNSYESYVFEVSVRAGRLGWKVWAPRDSWSQGTPRWRDGSAAVDPRDLLFGPVQHHSRDHGEPVEVTVRLPHGDDHTVSLKLREVVWRRARARREQERRWDVTWGCRPGIATGRHGEISGSSVVVSAASVQSGVWPLEAAGKIAVQLTEMRAASGLTELPTEKTAPS